METVKDLLLLIGSIVTGVKDLKSICNSIPIGIVLPPNKKKLVDLQENISSLEKKISDLESKANVGFPQLKQLLRSYSRLISDVRIAKALSDKVAELIGTSPSLAPMYKTIFTSQIETLYGQVNTGISQFPALDSSETGSLNTRLGLIDDLIRDLKRVSPDNDAAIKQSFDEISTHYTHIESILSRLLERILNGFDPPKS